MDLRERDRCQTIWYSFNLAQGILDRVSNWELDLTLFVMEDMKLTSINGSWSTADKTVVYDVKRKRYK